MALRVIGPTVAIAVNLPLAVWALLKAPRSPAYRTFAMLAISLTVWNLGGQVFHHGGVESLWMRLSFVGMALVPANFLCLAIAASNPGAVGAWWLMWLYVPPLVLGLLLDPAMAAQNAISPAWRSGFYRLSGPDAVIFAGVAAIYLAAALWISWRHARSAVEGADWVFYLALFPLVVGILCVLAVGYLRRERSPTVSLWAMVMSQYVMFMMIRNGLVKLDISLKRGVTLAFSAAVLAGCVLLAIAFCGALFGRTVSQEMSLILVVSAVALCVLYAAILPRLEDLLGRLLHRRPGRDDGAE